MPDAVEWRYPTAHNKMLQPFVWSNLDDAAKWLAGRTGKPWGAREVLNAALRYPIGDYTDHSPNRCTAIGVALPHGYSIEHAVLNTEEIRPYLEKRGFLSGARQNERVIPICTLPVRPVALLQTHVRQLLECGWVEIATAREWLMTGWKVRGNAPLKMVDVATDRDRLVMMDEDDTMNIVTPPFVAELENTGIPWRCLVELADRWKADNPAGPVDADQGTPASGTKEPPQEWRNGLKRMAYEEAVKLIREHGVLHGPALWEAMRARDDVKPAGRDSDQIEPTVCVSKLTRGEARVSKTQVQNAWRKSLAELLL